ncbi:MAG: hypothetical protein VX304_05960, partial [Planctomycetota bacterium]|nr:hypothetical protein [Planctomycetota bacterium]
MPDHSSDGQLRTLLESAEVGQLTMKVRHQVPPDDTFEAGMALMGKHSHGCALLCHDGQLDGIMTEKDIL